MENKVRILREDKNLTQTELAEKTGLSLRTIQRIEAGSIPKGYTLKTIANALEIEPGKLFTHTGQSIEINRAKLINISSLSFLILPFGNIIIPAILTYKTEDLRTKELGKSILSIQIIWTAITCVLMVSSPFLQVQLFIKIPLFVIFLILLFCINILVILKNGICLNQTSDLAFKLKTSIV